MAQLHAEGTTAAGFQADAADPESLKAALNQIFAQLGTPGVLVYNAAKIQEGLPSTLSPERVLFDFQVNVVGALVCIQQIIPRMRSARQGTILLTGGGLALNPRPQYASLAMGKASLRNLCFSLAAELEPAGIHVATITVAGFVRPGTHFDPDLIAEEYWELHSQPVGAWERAMIYRST